MTALDPLWVREAGAWRPEPLARGPWDPDALHAGPVAGLLARELERLPSSGPMRYVRFTLEVLRPVPFAALTLAASVVRPGRRVELAAAVLRAGREELCRASGWRVRMEDGALDLDADPEPPPPGPEGLSTAPFPENLSGDTFGGEPTEHRWAAGGWGVGPGTVWMRLRAPLVAGEEPSAFQAVCALADFGNGVSTAVSWEDHVFVNTDLTVYLEREPAPPWVCLEARTRLDPGGSGVAESALYDERGRIGRALQSLYAARR